MVSTPVETRMDPAVKLAVPASWDTRLIEGLVDLNARHGSVYEVFGSLRQSFSGSAHSAAAIGGACGSRAEVEDFVRALRATGIRFNYTLNASCLGNREFSKSGRQKLMEEMEWVASIADSVTVTIPYLVELFRRTFPLEVVVSVVAGVDCVRKAKFFEELGASRITLDISINRDFGVLEDIRRRVSCDLQIMVNDGCLLQCPYRAYHYNAGSHASQEDATFYMEYPILRCTMHRLENPVEFLKMPWIRPEDLKEYAAYAEIFKIAGREKPTDWILNCARSYSEREYTGNLLDLITLVSPASHELGEMVLGSGPRFYLDNQRLDGFLERFKNHRCEDCAACGYCERFAAEVLEIDEPSVAGCLRKMKRMEQLVFDFDAPRNRLAYLAVRGLQEGYVKRDWRWRAAKRALSLLRRKGRTKAQLEGPR